MSKKAGKFEVIAVTKFKDLKKGDFVVKSDLALQDSERVFQFRYHPEKSKIKKRPIKPGIWSLKQTNMGVDTVKIEMGKKRLLLEATSSKALLDEAKLFFNNLEVYDRLELQKKRGVLLYSKPGLGKSSSIAHFCLESIKEDSGTVVIVWPTGQIDADSVCSFLSSEAKLTKKCTRLILILEDIGGGEHENHGGPRGVDSGLLSLLDGVAVSFSKPTFIIATTNHPENLLASLADRPGRFDKMVALYPPATEERLKLLEFIAKRALSDKEIKAFSNESCKDLSMAHLSEIVIRSELHGKAMETILQEILEHQELVANSFEKKGKFGFGMSDDT